MDPCRPGAQPAAARRRHTLDPVPPSPGPGVCPRCCGPTHRGECFCCRVVGARLGEGPDDGPPVVALTLCRQGDALHRVLRGYKDAPAAAARRHFAMVLGSTVDRRLRTDRRALALVERAEWVALVPSTVRRRPGETPSCPFGDVVRGVARLGALYHVAAGRGPGVARHLAPDPSAFRVEAAPERPVLVMDDAWVTGARARSLAAALTEAGAEVVGIVVAARMVNPGAAPWLARWWAHHGPAGQIVSR